MIILEESYQNHPNMTTLRLDGHLMDAGFRTDRVPSMHPLIGYAPLPSYVTTTLG